LLLKLRIVWYLILSKILDDEEAQRRGVVVVAYMVGPSRLKDIDPNLIKEGARYVQGLPIQFAAFHYCFNDARLYPVIALAQFVLGTNTRLQFQVHCGTWCRSMFIHWP
jgi:hypothetical protein